MQLRYRLVLPLVAFCLALAVAPALAAKTAPTPMPTPVQSQSTINSTSSLCQLGVLGPAVNAYGYILPPDDQYYTLLNPAQCPGCHEDGYHLSLSHMELYFTEPCQIPVSVAIAPAFDDDGDGCWTPNPFAAPLCGPVSYVINDGGVLSTCVDYALPVPGTNAPGGGPCCITGRAFLLIEFDQGTCPNGRPAFCGPPACQLCTQWNYYPGAGFPGDDLCAVLTPFGLTGNIMYVDTDCCSPTPTLPGSWGSLKTLYR